MHALDRWLAIFSAVVLVTGLFSSTLKARLPASAPLVAVLCGVALGPVGLGVLGLPASAGSPSVIEQVARITLAISLMASALRLPPRYMFKRWRQVGLLLGGGMLLMWLFGGLALLLALHLPLALAALLGAIVTPTDPVLAGAIVSGEFAERNIPARIRDLMTAESGANDGMAYPFVALPLLALSVPQGSVLGHWALDSLLWEVGGALALGALVGIVAGHGVAWALKRGTIDHTSFLGISLALSLMILGAFGLLGLDGILGVFVGGVAFNDATLGQHLQRQEHVQAAVGRYFDLPIFVLLGSVLPWAAWGRLGWAVVVAPALVLLVRRIPALLLIARGLKPSLRSTREALFVGWFGPIGISALFYTVLSLQSVHDQRIWAIGTLIIFSSIVVHGVTATPFTALFGRGRHEAHTRRQDEDAPREAMGTASGGAGAHR